MSEVAVEPRFSNSWEIVPLENVITTRKGKKPNELGEETPDRNIPYIDIKAFDSKIIRRYCTDEKIVLCDENDVLVVWDGSRSGLVGIGAKGAVGSTIAKIEASLIEPKYLYYYLQSNFVYLNTNTRGVGIPHVDPGVFNNLKFPLAPAEQQKRIVAKIEELFSHIDAGIAALNKAKKLLKQYRQSVLKAAVTGELTKEWREQNKHKLEPASQLLERILQQRRQKWEEQQLAQFKAKGKTPKDDKWKGKYKEPDRAEKSNIEIPDGWTLASFEQLILSSQNGLSKRKSIEGTMTHVLRLADITNGRIVENQARDILMTDIERERYLLEKDDLLCIRVNGSIDLVGRMVRVDVDEDWAFCDHFIRFRLPLSLINVSYIDLLFDSQYCRDFIDKNKVSSAGQNTVSQGTMGRIAVNLSSVAEQNKIMERADKKFKAMERLGVEINVQLIKAEKNKQSILASAFSGKLG